MAQKPVPAPPFVLPRAQAVQALRLGQPKNGVLVGTRDPNTGQSSGPPGQGPEPFLFHEPGGATVDDLLHPAFQMVDHLFRALPEDSWFDPNVSPSRPIQMELGVFTVPKGTAFWMFDYEFRIFRMSGVDPGDFIPAEDGRFGGVMGFDLNFSGRRMSDLLFQLDPVSVLTQRPTFELFPFRIGDIASSAQFNRSAAQSFAANASPGLSLLPVQLQRYGPRNGPFTLIAPEGTQVSLNCVIFKPVPSPLATIQGSTRGYLIHTQVSSELINRVRPR